MWHRTTHKWADPRAFVAGIPESEAHWVLLYSGMQAGFTGGRSILALRMEREIVGEDFSKLESCLSNDQQVYENAWFGYLGYELKHAVEVLPEDRPGGIRWPRLWMANFRLILVFDHEVQTVEVYTASEEELAHIPVPCDWREEEVSGVSNLASNMTREEYLTKVDAVLDAIVRGDIYQANLTRKFFGHTDTDPRAVFLRLCEVSPAPYSALLRMDARWVVSSSPERFLHLNAQGRVESRPIKGSAARLADSQEDARQRQALEQSQKDRAENLMIVDLMRNDLSRSCREGSVEVADLFGVTSYATVHHMASTVSGVLDLEKTALDCVKACFPPGSMTGAPKIRAMEICSQLEQVQRGVYSGAIGWFGGDGSCDLSVVIRTLCMENGRFEFQVGGGIVADSQPESEWEETLTKARGIALALGIDETALRAL